MHHKFGLSTTPVYSNGVVFATFGNELFAFDADIRDGKDEGIKDEPEGRDRHDILWKAPLEAKNCKASPLLYEDMVVLNTSSGVEFFPTRPKNFRKVERIKKYETPGSFSAGAAHNGSILVAASKSGHVAFDLKRDRQIWKVESAGSGHTSPCIDGERVFFGDGAGRVRCVRIRDGAEIWKADASIVLSSDCKPSAHDGVVYVTGGRDATVHALDAGTGREIWSFKVPDKLEKGVQEGYGSSVYTCPLIADGKIYFTSYSGYIYCLTATKKKTDKRLLWKHQISERICMTVPFAYRGAIYVRGFMATYKFGPAR